MSKKKIILRGLKHPSLVLGLIDRKLKLTKAGKVSHDGERLVIKNWASAIKSDSFVTLAHVHRYLWVQNYITNGTCLDAGCGSGYGTNFLAEKSSADKIIGIDRDEEAIKFCREKYKNPRLEFMTMDVTKTEFADNYFDFIISFDVLEHLDEDNQKRFIAEIARTLKAEGTAFVGCPNGEKIPNWKPNKFHLNELTLGKFDELLRKYFETVKICGQDLIFKGVRQQQNQDNNILNLNISNFIIVEDGYISGLLSICKKPKKILN